MVLIGLYWHVQSIFRVYLLHSTLLQNILLQSVQIQGPLLHNWYLESRALQLPELGHLVKEVEFDSCMGLQLIQPLIGQYINKIFDAVICPYLDSWGESQLVHVYSKGRLPFVRRLDLAKCDWSIKCLVIGQNSVM